MKSSDENCENDNYLKNMYSGDASRNRNLQEDTHRLYMLNTVLMIIYYLLLFIFVFLTFADIRESVNRIKKSLLIVILFLYPIIIFPFQYNIYHVFRKNINSLFQNIYLSEDW